MNQELADQLIAWYEAALLQIKKKWFLWTMLKVARKLHVDSGVCKCANNVFNTYIMSNPFIMSNSEHSRLGEGYYTWWCSPVFNATSKREVIKLLQTRIDILKTYKS